MAAASILDTRLTAILTVAVGKYELPANWVAPATEDIDGDLSSCRC